MLSLVTPFGGVQLGGGTMLFGILVPGTTMEPLGKTWVPLGRPSADENLVPGGSIMPGGTATSDATLTLGGTVVPAAMVVPGGIM